MTPPPPANRRLANDVNTAPRIAALSTPPRVPVPAGQEDERRVCLKDTQETPRRRVSFFGCVSFPFLTLASCPRSECASPGSLCVGHVHGRDRVGHVRAGVWTQQFTVELFQRQTVLSVSNQWDQSSSLSKCPRRPAWDTFIQASRRVGQCVCGCCSFHQTLQMFPLFACHTVHPVLCYSVTSPSLFTPKHLLCPFRGSSWWS